jgi:multicomponent Na+:H+ antiporter subunit C
VNSALLFASVGVLLFMAGIAGALLVDAPVRRALALNVTSSGAFLALVGLAQRGGTIDPVPHAMVLTGIVVAVAATALALALVRRLAGAPGED